MDTTLRFPPAPPLPPRVLTLDCAICETATPHGETRDRTAFVCGCCGNEVPRIVMNTPPLLAFLGGEG